MPRETAFKQTLCADIDGITRPALASERVFEIDMAHSPQGGVALKIMAVILNPPAIEKILTHLGLQARAPAPGRALQAA